MLAEVERRLIEVERMLVEVERKLVGPATWQLIDLNHRSSPLTEMATVDLFESPLSSGLSNICLTKHYQDYGCNC
jgi:hypothetical protein